MEGTQPDASPAPPPTSRRRSWALALVLALAVILVAAVLSVNVFTPQPTPAAPVPGSPIALGLAAISGNESSGWTYSVRVYVHTPWERPDPIVWGNLNVWLVNVSGVTLPPFPPGTTLRASSAANATVAEYDCTVGVWRDGFYALVEDGQALVLHSGIPPGAFLQSGTVGYVTGASLWVEYLNDGAPVLWGVSLARS